MGFLGVDAGFRRQRKINPFIEHLRKPFVGIQRDVRQGSGMLDAPADDPARDAVRVTEGDILFYQVFCNLRGEAEVFCCELFEPVFLEACVLEHPVEKRYA